MNIMIQSGLFINMISSISYVQNSNTDSNDDIYIVHTVMYRHTCTEIQSAQYQSLDGKCSNVNEEKAARNCLVSKSSTLYKALLIII